MLLSTRQKYERLQFFPALYRLRSRNVRFLPEKERF